MWFLVIAILASFPTSSPSITNIHMLGEDACVRAMLKYNGNSPFPSMTSTATCLNIETGEVINISDAYLLQRKE